MEDDMIHVCLWSPGKAVSQFIWKLKMIHNGNETIILWKHEFEKQEKHNKRDPFFYQTKFSVLLTILQKPLLKIGVKQPVF